MPKNIVNTFQYRRCQYVADTNRLNDIQKMISSTNQDLLKAYGKQTGGSYLPANHLFFDTVLVSVRNAFHLFN